MPTPSAGVKPWMGNKNPVRLVSTVVSRKSAVVSGSRFEANIPPTTTSPLPMAISVMTTWKSVKAPIDSPRTMTCSPILCFPVPNASLRRRGEGGYVPMWRADPRLHRVQAGLRLLAISWLARTLANFGKRPPGEAPELDCGGFGHLRRRHPGLKFREPAAEFSQIFGRKLENGFFDVFDLHDARIVVTPKERKRYPDAALPRSAWRRIFRILRQIIGDFEPRRLAGDEAVQFRPY